MITPHTAVCYLHARYQGSGPVYFILFIINARYQGYMITPHTAVCHLHARYQGSGPVYFYLFVMPGIRVI